MSYIEIAYALREAFRDGYHAYASPCCAYNTEQEAWESSDQINLYNQLMLRIE